jgi:hypothetical protein
MQWINNRGGWGKLKPKVKRAIKQQIREGRRAIEQDTPEGIALKIKAERHRYQAHARYEYRKALKRRDGSQGAASAVRRIDPASVDIDI